jgi:hypothetical protein
VGLRVEHGESKYSEWGRSDGVSWVWSHSGTKSNAEAPPLIPLFLSLYCHDEFHGSLNEVVKAPEVFVLCQLLQPTIKVLLDIFSRYRRNRRK